MPVPLPVKGLVLAKAAPIALLVPTFGFALVLGATLIALGHIDDERRLKEAEDTS